MHEQSRSHKARTSSTSSSGWTATWCQRDSPTWPSPEFVGGAMSRSCSQSSRISFSRSRSNLWRSAAACGFLPNHTLTSSNIIGPKIDPLAHPIHCWPRTPSKIFLQLIPWLQNSSSSLPLFIELYMENSHASIALSPLLHLPIALTVPSVLLTSLCKVRLLEFN